MSLVPFDPNGMVMDLLRSCSRQTMRYIAGQPAEQAIGTWYFAKKTALPFPIPHSFGSPVWDTFHPMPTDIGFNAEAARTWYRGTPLNSSDGTKWAGDLDWFVNGADQAENLPRGSNGTPVECLAPPFGIASGGTATDTGLSVGGLLSGGKTFIPAVACSECTGPTPEILSITLTGFTNGPTNATWVFTQDPVFSCLWTAGSGGVALSLSRAGGFFWNLTITDGVGAALYQGGGGGCIGSFSMAKLVSTNGGDDPLTLLTS